MRQPHETVPAWVPAIARDDGWLDFKNEGETEDGIPVGKLTLRSSTGPVFADGRWVTKRQALQIAEAWGVELYEY